MEPTLILTSKSLDDTPFAETVAGVLGLPFRFLPQAEVLKHLNREACKDPVLFSLAGADCARWMVESVLPRLRSKTAPVHPELVHLLGSLGHQENLRELADSDVYGSFVQRSQVGVKETALVYAELLRPMLLRRLGIKKELKLPKDVAPWGFQVRGLEAKPASLRELEELLAKHSSYPPKVIEAVILTTDELLTRAFGDGNSAGPEREPVEVSIVSKENEVRVTVTDLFGGVKRAGFLSGILRDSSEPTTGRATQGLALIFRRGGSLSFRCVSGRSTEATAYFRLSKDYRGILEQTRFISLQGGTG
jgi:hypothetical protein